MIEPQLLGGASEGHRKAQRARGRRRGLAGLRPGASQEALQTSTSYCERASMTKSSVTRNGWLDMRLALEIVSVALLPVYCSDAELQFLLLTEPGR